MIEPLPDPRERAAAPSGAPGFALWSLGFRPFYLLASVFSAVSVLLWVVQYSGWLPSVYQQGPLWHGHEMLFGYTLAVVAGFLLTAVRAWTGQPTPVGAPLMAVDRTPDDLGTFAALVEESRQFGTDWAVVFVASLPGRAGRAPTSKEADQPLQRMIESIKAGSIGSFIPFDRRGEPVQLA